MYTNKNQANKIYDFWIYLRYSISVTTRIKWIKFPLVFICHFAFLTHFVTIAIAFLCYLG